MKNFTISNPTLLYMQDELDSLVAAYGPTLVLEMFNDARHNFNSFGPFNPPIHEGT